jgi:para-aminobenzoate synthetase component I
MTPLVEELSPPPDPAGACERLAGLSHRIFLDSAARRPRLGRYSFLAADPIALVRSVKADTSDPLDDVRRQLAPHQTEPIPGLPP